MIEKRAKAFVTSKGLVPVDKIASDIGKGKTVDGLKRLFPMLSTDDIFEAVEFYAENTSLPLMEEEKMLLLNSAFQKELCIEKSRNTKFKNN